MGYYLADGIYPPWATSVKTIPRPKGNKRSHFATHQESTRKDVESAFSVLQKRFAIVHDPAELLELQGSMQIMTCWITLHNMIIGDERDILENF